MSSKKRYTLEDVKEMRFDHHEFYPTQFEFYAEIELKNGEQYFVEEDQDGDLINIMTEERAWESPRKTTHFEDICEVFDDDLYWEFDKKLAEYKRKNPEGELGYVVNLIYGDGEDIQIYYFHDDDNYLKQDEILYKEDVEDEEDALTDFKIQKAILYPDIGDEDEAEELGFSFTVLNNESDKEPLAYEIVEWEF